MIQQLPPTTARDIIYPDSDGQPMSDNTKQFRWIVTIKENLELFFATVANVFIAGDLLWYPVEGNNKIRQAPDVMVVFGRLKGDRGSYKQWEDGNIAPQVVFEILSPGNRLKAMAQKLRFYDRYGVEEYYIYDPDDGELIGWLRREEEDLDVIPEMNNWGKSAFGNSLRDSARGSYHLSSRWRAVFNLCGIGAIARTGTTTGRPCARSTRKRAPTG